MSTAGASIVPVVLAGGAGTRLWPLSRTARPKQFLSLTGERSLFQETLLRLAEAGVYDAPVIVTNEAYRFMVAEQAQEVGVKPGAIVLEPVGRNTAPAIAAATLIAEGDGQDRLVHVLPSDHHIVVDEAYRAALDAAVGAAMHGRLVTFGIRPAEPATGFGYIEAGEALACGSHPVARFVEKPDADSARRMIETGGFYWNSGMFVFRTSTLLGEYALLAAEVLNAARRAVEEARRDLDFLRLDEEAFAAAPDISIDYAIFEKTQLAAVVPAPIRWSDLGTWDSVWKSGPQDGEANVTRGPVVLNAVASSLVVSETLPVVVDGVEDIAVLASEDAVYVGRLSSAPDMGAIVKRLAADPGTRALTETHRTTYRPWGGYTSALAGDRFQVKRLFVKPGCQLSLQSHHHRAEHWVVVKGTAEIRIGDETRSLGENESAYIPRGAVHRLANRGRIPLEIIEVQTGSYLGEDDIVRIEDEFNRQ